MHDTQSINQHRQDLSTFDEIWVFGYGSLIYKVDFPFIEKQYAMISGWERRFWMLSHDHRGTPEQPGIVLTLTPVAEANCFGIAYRITEAEFEHLDHREKNGYLREEININFDNGRSVKGLIYIGDQASSVYLGPTPVEQLSEHIFRSRGPSGENSEYVFKMAEALKQHNVEDEHIFAIEKHLLTLLIHNKDINKPSNNSLI
jgi:cation transport protein ChaC